MQTLKNNKCLTCGGDIILSEDRKHGECGYCHRKYEYESSLTDDKSIIDYEQATEYWHTFRFADAKRKFLDVANKNPEFSEAWWGAFVSEYGIEFVTNKFGGQIPTCHRAHTVSVFDNENYKKAIETANGETKETYHSLGEKIENIRKGIIEKSNADEIYDIFICFKATEVDDDRRKTIDYDLGREIYSTLNKEGYRVFFAPETLLQVAEQEYEPYIYRALSTAKVMLLLCSDNKEIESAWVKNEWSRFLYIHNGQGLIPICGNKFEPYSPNSLPEELQKLNAIEYNGRLFEQILTKVHAYLPEIIQGEVLRDWNEAINKSSAKKNAEQNKNPREDLKGHNGQSDDIVKGEGFLLSQKLEQNNNAGITKTEQKTVKFKKQNSHYKYLSLIADNKQSKLWLIFCVVAVGLSILSLLIGWLWGWSVYQWVVGISVAIIFLASGFFVSIRVRDDKIFKSIELGIFVLINYILCFILKEKYNVVCYWTSGAALIFGVVTAIKAACENETCFIVLLECILTLILIIINLWFGSEWEVRQWIIGIGVTIILILLYGLSISFTEADEGWVGVLAIPVVVINVILMINFGDRYTTISYCVNGATLLFSICATVISIKNEEKWSVIEIFTVIFVVLLILASAFNITLSTISEWFSDLRNIFVRL